MAGTLTSNPLYYASTLDPKASTSWPSKSLPLPLRCPLKEQRSYSKSRGPAQAGRKDPSWPAGRKESKEKAPFPQRGSGLTARRGRSLSQRYQEAPAPRRTDIGLRGVDLPHTADQTILPGRSATPPPAQAKQCIITSTTFMRPLSSFSR